MMGTLILGMVFGFLLQYAKLNQFNTISGMAILKDLTVAKAIATAIGAGIILVNLEIYFGFASYHLKPFLVTGIMLGGFVFGVGMAILGYCPGTMAVSLGEGSLDALIGIVGGLSGGVVYTLLVPTIADLRGPDLGKVSLYSAIGEHTTLFLILTILVGIAFVAVAFWLNKLEKSKSYKWLIAGLGLAVLNTVIFNSNVSDRVMGAATLYPYLGDLICGVTDNAYFEKISGSGNWQIYFLGGAFLTGLIMAIIQGRFKFVLIHHNWKTYKNNSSWSRIIWSFIGGFILIFGARFAGGCTSGHVISGGMQIAFSSLVFAAFVFAGLLVTGKLFYKAKGH